MFKVIVAGRRDFDKYGKSAGHIRNKEMAKYSDVLIAYHDGASRGTQYKFDIARKE